MTKCLKRYRPAWVDSAGKSNRRQKGKKKKNRKENNKKLTAKTKNRYDVIAYFIIWLSPLSKAVA